MNRKSIITIANRHTRRIKNMAATLIGLAEDAQEMKNLLHAQYDDDLDRRKKIEIDYEIKFDKHMAVYDAERALWESRNSDLKHTILAMKGLV